jgi:hypothetical protein
MNTKRVNENEKFRSNVLLILLKMCTSLSECIMLLEEDFKDLGFEKVRVAWSKFMADFTNLLKEKEKLSSSPGPADALNFDLGEGSHG